VGLQEKRSRQNKTVKEDEFLASILDSAAQIKKREDKLRRTTRHNRKRVAKCIEVNDEIFVHLL
jgi:hypothetical protein